jgi:hypothetical protein
MNPREATVPATAAARGTVLATPRTGPVAGNAGATPGDLPATPDPDHGPAHATPPDRTGPHLTATRDDRKYYGR